MTDRAAVGPVPVASGPTRVGLSPRALVIWTIVISAAVRLVMGQIVGFGNGEGYYLASARHLALSYFDQPPLSLWIAHFAIDLFGTSSPLLPRLPYIAIFAGNTWLMYRLGARLFGEAAGAWSAVLLNLSVLFTVSVGSWVQPDAPLFFFLTAAALPLVELTFGETKHPLSQWAIAGACFGMAMLAKYHAAAVLRPPPVRVAVVLESPSLSPRETEVLGLMARGFSYAEIAKLQAVSVHTVQSQIKSLYAKLAVNSKTEAVFEATRMGLLRE